MQIDLVQKIEFVELLYIKTIEIFTISIQQTQLLNLSYQQNTK